MLTRRFTTTAAALKGQVLPKFETAEQLARFLRTPTGNVHDVVPKAAASVDSTVVRKMLRLSGLNADISPEMEHKYISALNTQIAFLNNISDPDIDELSAEHASSEVFRLIVSDHRPPKPLTLEALLAQVESNAASEEPGKLDYKAHLRSSVTLS